MKNFSSPVLATVIAIFGFFALAMGFDVHALLMQHGDVLSGLGLLSAAGTLEIKDLLPAIEDVKQSATLRFDKVDEKQGELQARLLEVEQKMARRGNAGLTGVSGSERENVGEVVASCEQLEGVRNGSVKSFRVAVKSFPVGIKAAITNAGVPGVAERDLSIYGPLARRMTVRDLLITQPTSAPSIEYLTATRTGDAAIQAAEGDAKAELAAGFELKTAQVRTIACWIPASRQVLDDSAQLKDFIDTTLLDALQLTEDAQLLKGDGVGANILGLMTAASAYSRAVVGDTPNDTLRRAITQVQLARGVASGIVINPIGLESLELQKDAEGRYLVSFSVTDANGRTISWRVPVVVTDAIGPTEFLVGDFTLAARLYDRQQANVEVATQHADFFVKNMLAVLAEERLALTLPRPDLLVKGTFGA